MSGGPKDGGADTRDGAPAPARDTEGKGTDVDGTTLVRERAGTGDGAGTGAAGHGPGGGISGGIGGAKGALWLAWRQQRVLILSALALLAIGAALVAAARADLLNGLHSDWLVRCDTQPLKVSPDEALRCSEFYQTQTQRLNAMGMLMVALPLLVGLFWGAPLLGRDAEQGTSKLVLTQDTGRGTWFTARFGLAAVSSALLTTGFALLFEWWREPFGHNRFSGMPWYTDVVLNGTGPRAVAATLFGLALGTVAGLLLRRTLMAMVVTLAGGGLVAFAVHAVRRALVAPQLYLSSGPRPKVPMGEKWSSGSYGFLDGAGHRTDVMACPYPSGGQLRECMESHGFVQRFYEANPASDRWVFQAWETGILLGLAVLLIVATGWLLRRRRI